MKKSRFISALTSIVMTAGLLAGAMPFSTTAADDSVVEKPTDMSLRLGAEKTSFTMDEVAAGDATTTVSLYADNFNDAEKMTVIMAGFGASDDGIEISGIKFPDYMGLSTQTKVGDEDWDEAKLRFKVGADETNKNFYIQGDPLDPMVAEDLTRPIVQFTVKFDEGMSEGKYEINFDNPNTAIEVQSGYEFRSASEIAGSSVPSGLLITSYKESARKNAKPVTITLGESGDDKPTQSTGDEKHYDGFIDIYADDVVAEAGKQIEVPVYANTNGGTIAGLEVKIGFDESAFKLVDMKAGTGIKGAASVNPDTGAYVIAQSDEDPLTNKPEKAICTLYLEATGAVEGKTYPITFSGTNGSSEILAMKTKGQDDAPDTYYKVNVKGGSVTIKAANTEPTGKIYDGKIKIWADKVKAAPGETVTVNMYADSNGSDVAGLEVKAVFDSSVLKLTDMKAGTGIKGAASVNPDTGAYVIAQADEDALKNNPSKPIATLTFKVSDNAAPGVYTISFEGTNGSSEILAMKTKGQGDDPDTYLEVETENGSVTVEVAETELPTTAEPTTVTSIVTVQSVVTETSIVTVQETVTSLVTVQETVTSVVTVPETVTSLVTIQSVVTETSVVTVTSEVIVTKPEAPTEPTTEATTEAVKIEVVVPDANDVSGNSLYWYHSDNDEFYRDGIIVVKNGEEDITADAVVEFDKKPAEVYDGKNFEYEVEFRVSYNDEVCYEGTLPVLIGYRGDADKSGDTKVTLYDAIAIAKSLLPSGKKYDTKTFEGFLADNDENGKVELYDAINVAKFLLPSNKAWNKVLKDYDKLTKS